MLLHEVIGPDPDGFFLVAYPTPGARYAQTVTDICKTKEQADILADQRNMEQVRREEELSRDRALRGFRLFHPLVESWPQ